MLLEVAVGLVAVALVLLGVMVMAGPALPRTIRAAARRRAPSGPAEAATKSRGPRAGPPGPTPAPKDPVTNPTTLRALGAASRLYSLLRAGGENVLADDLRDAARRVRKDEAGGLLALAGVLKPLREVALEGDAGIRYERLLAELRNAVKDRSEQLELLHFR